MINEMNKIDQDNQEQEPKKDSYIITSLRDACQVLDVMMREMTPDKYHSSKELAELLPGYTSNKIYRILKTFESMGWVEKEPSQPRYKIGHPLLYLSHKYMQKLHQEHLKIVQEVNRFNI